MLTGIHFLLSYACNFECDHCFVFSGPAAEGTFTIRQIQAAIEEARKIGTVEWIYFEGGEPCLYYPLMLEGVKRARAMGFQLGVVTNAYFATSVEDARLWLQIWALPI
jgi:MoaA/NifB/PqqE/SkfB family radical SAM enzyme